MTDAELNELLARLNEESKERITRTRDKKSRKAWADAINSMNAVKVGNKMKEAGKRRGRPKKVEVQDEMKEILEETAQNDVPNVEEPQTSYEKRSEDVQSSYEKVEQTAKERYEAEQAAKREEDVATYKRMRDEYYAVQANANAIAAETTAYDEPEETPTSAETALDEAQNEDTINHPSHYTKGRYEVIDIIEQAVQDWSGVLAVCIGNVIKYVMRAPYKGSRLENLKKARWYLDKAISILEARK